jgi:hypothetical protein
MRMQSGLASVCALVAVLGTDVLAEEFASPRLRDRGEGLPTSMFNTFIDRGEWLVYTFVEAYFDSDMEYKPAELGHTLDQDFRGEYTAIEELVFLAYGLNDWLAVEIEAAVIQAELQKNSDDTSSMPEKLEESGLGDVEGQLRWRYSAASDERPEFFGYFECVGPTQDEGALIGTSDWEFKFGSGLIRSYPFGTIAARAAVEYNRSESKVEQGELAVEWMRRLSERARVYAGIEGAEDEFEWITDLQWQLTDRASLKFGTGIGLTSKATDVAPEFGILWRF